ncbi:MAG: DUF4330 family protein [Clostridiales bacterium]|nr:DUF4330 family protein [Clostridiales bacterium]
MRKNGVGGASSKSIRITIVDVIIIITAAVFIAMLIHYTFARDNSGDGYIIQYVVKVAGVRDELSDRITVGDAVYNMEDSLPMGTVTAFSREASTDEKGRTIPGMMDLYVTIEANARPYGVGSAVSGHVIYAEGWLELRTSKFYFGGVCIDVSR